MSSRIAVHTECAGIRMIRPPLLIPARRGRPAPSRALTATSPRLYSTVLEFPTEDRNSGIFFGQRVRGRAGHTRRPRLGEPGPWKRLPRTSDVDAVRAQVREGV